MPKKIDREVLLGFVEEARGYMPRILEGIDHIHRGSAAGEHLQETHRLTHSIKGVAGMLGLTALANVADLLEEALEQVAAGQLAADADTSEVLADTAAGIGRYLDQLATGHCDDLPMVTPVVTAFRRLRGLPEAGDLAEIERLCPAGEESVLAPPAARVGELPAEPVLEPFGEPVSESAGERSRIPEPSPPSVARATAPPSSDLLESFREEATDHLAQAGGGLRRLQHAADDAEALQAVRRAIHTLKGAAAMVGRARCAELAHRMEDLLDELHESGAAVDSEPLDLLFATADALEDMVEGGSSDGAALAALYGRYEESLGAREAAPPAPEVEALGEPAVIDLSESAASPETPVAAPEASQGPMVRVPIARLDEVVRLLSELVVSGSTFERHQRQLARDVGELHLSTQHLKRLSHRFESEYEAFALTRPRENLVAAGGAPVGSIAGNAAGSVAGNVAWHPSATGFDELELDRYTEFHRVSRQLGESANDLSTLEGGLSHRVSDFDSYLNRVTRLTGEIQDKLMRLRMVPFAQLSSRLYRTVRVTAGDLGKRVDLLIEGEQTALDKTVLEEISDPLLHLLRNAVDHGIEPPSLRQGLGKPERGQIRLRAFHEGTQVVIEISDDGGGLDDEKLRSRAVEVGLMSESEAALASPEELHRLIFEPGFSTASRVSEVSGRGVGLDVVQSVVHRLEGSVVTRSNPGQGTTLTIRLPLTLAIIRAILVSSGEQTYALPLSPVRQILRLDPEDLEDLGQESVVRVRDRAYPAVRLSEALGQSAPRDSAPRRLPCLILDLGERQVALLVDRILEARDVVVKNLGNLLRRVSGVTGATLMGDGSVVLILNPQDLVGIEAREQPRQPRLVTPRPAIRPLEVMVVDDSVSVRRVLSNLLRSQGWNPVTARDGLEALETIERANELPDVILLDIEMPRMDGYELTTTLRTREIYRDIPIVMLTSRAGDKHRKRALDVGATEYLVKPYQDDVLIQLLRRLARRGGSQTADA